MIHSPVAPDAWHSCRVKDRLDISTGFIHSGFIPQITLDRGNPQSLQGRILTSTEDSDRMSLLKKLFNDIQAKKPASACDKSMHANVL
jgi:hypothetical protein